MTQTVSETAILKKKNSLQYLKLNLPNPIRNQVLVKIFYSGVCASQCTVRWYNILFSY
mgnify:CR=1 FL=1